MSARFLLIDSDPQQRRRLREHLSIAFEQAIVDEFDPALEGPLPPEFTAAAFDAVLLGDVVGADEVLPPPDPAEDSGDDAGATGLPKHDPDLGRSTIILSEKLKRAAGQLARESAHQSWLDDLARRVDFPPVVALGRAGCRRRLAAARRGGPRAAGLAAGQPALAPRPRPRLAPRHRPAPRPAAGGPPAAGRGRRLQVRQRLHPRRALPAADRREPAVRRVPGGERALRSRGGAEGAAAGAGRHREQQLRPLPAGIPDHRGHPAPERGADLRPRRRGRPCLHRDGVLPARRPAPAHQAGRVAGRRADRAAADGRGAAGACTRPACCTATSSPAT